MFSSSPSRPLAALLAQLTLLGAIALPVLAAALWFFWNDIAPLATGHHLSQVYDVAGIGLGARLAGFFLTLAAASIQAYGLLGVRMTFLEAAQRRSFSDRAVKGFSRFAWVCLAMVFIGIIHTTGLIAIISASDPLYPGALSIQFGSHELKALFTALIFVFVAQVFTEAKRANDENEAFI